MSNAKYKALEKIIDKISKNSDGAVSNVTEFLGKSYAYQIFNGKDKEEIKKSILAIDEALGVSDEFTVNEAIQYGVDPSFLKYICPVWGKYKEAMGQGGDSYMCTVDYEKKQEGMMKSALCYIEAIGSNPTGSLPRGTGSIQFRFKANEHQLKFFEYAMETNFGKPANVKKELIQK